MRTEGQIFVIDTGSPVSFVFEEENRLRLKTLPFELPGGMVGIRKEDLDKLIGAEIAGLIGLDIIMRYGLTLDKGTKKVLLSAYSDDLPFSFPFSFRNIMGLGVLSVDCSVNGNDIRAIFDTGASIGYIHKSVIGDAECTGEVKDFGPSFGEINTRKYRTVLRIGDVTTVSEMAEMNTAVELQTVLLGYKAIVGLNDFTWERAVIDPAENRVAFC
jgi:hypothetical protein